MRSHDKNSDKKAKEEFVGYLSSKGLSRSKSRLSLFDLVHAIHGHFRADEVLIMAEKMKIKISKASLYRNLVVLEEGGFIRRVEFTDKHAHYEHIYGHEHHEHLICKKCGKIVDFFSEEIEKSLEDIAVANGFRNLSHKVEIIGVCEECRG